MRVQMCRFRHLSAVGQRAGGTSSALMEGLEIFTRAAANGARGHALVIMAGKC